MKILYVNICSKNAYQGHKLFDVEWCKNLCTLGEVDLIQPTPDWFNVADERINLITFESEKYVKHKRLYKSKLLNIGRLRRLEPYRHACNKAILTFIKKLDSTKNYDIIIAAHFDIIVQFFTHLKKSLMNKIFVIEHFPPLNMSRPLKFLFNKKKNKFNHITMEKSAINVLANDVGIKKERVFYVPHPFNTFEINNKITIEKYDVVGLSNSNDDSYIKGIIDRECTNSFFAKNKIRALLRSQQYEFDNGYLKVFKGRLNLSFDEFYSYVSNSTIMLILFPISFGTRTSGTIIDALSYRVKSIGTPFPTYLSYCEDYPNVCQTFDDIEDLVKKIKTILENKDDRCQSDFDRFYFDRTGESLLSNLNKMAPTIRQKED